MDFFDTVVTEEAKSMALKCLSSGRLSEGALVKKFEKRLSRVFRMKLPVAVNSGTSALHLALILAGAGRGDEVILPAQTFVATGLAILYCGAKPVFADIGMDGNISWNEVKKKITNRTKAVICVSWGGNPCDLHELQKHCQYHDLKLIQDNAQALGATYQGQPLSDFGDFSCYSFQAIKALSTGDGGLLTCNNHEDYLRARRLRWFGIDRERDLVDDTGERNYNLTEIGYKYHMNDYSAALGLGNLNGFCERLARVKEIASQYDERLERDERDYSFTHKKSGCSYWLYDILVDDRDGFMKAMKSRDVPVSVVHKGIDRNFIFGEKDLPIQRYWDEHHVCLPIHSSMTDEDVNKVVESVVQGW